jgi:hypothetical protein
MLAVKWPGRSTLLTATSAHKHADGAKKGSRKRWEEARAGFNTKVHHKAEGNGKPRHFFLNPGQYHEMTVFESLMRGGSIKRKDAGSPEVRSHFLAGDKAYSYKQARTPFRNRRLSTKYEKCSVYILVLWTVGSFPVCFK